MVDEFEALNRDAFASSNRTPPVSQLLSWIRQVDGMESWLELPHHLQLYGLNGTVASSHVHLADAMFGTGFEHDQILASGRQARQLGHTRRLKQRTCSFLLDGQCLNLA
ncbi:hypothetical protein WKW80_12205 [Variovorax humicola]|uniref:Uncharacterized protein n=1 Tax=Variovorax humicola TaxID=1769758 RepID=A0ABU8VZG4_9BURK